MAFSEVRCPDCNGLNVVRYGKQPNGEQRYRCHNHSCSRQVFLLNYKTRTKDVSNRARIIEMALSGVDSAEISRLLGLSEGKVTEVFQMLSRFTAPPPAVRESKIQQPHVMAG